MLLIWGHLPRVLLLSLSATQERYTRESYAYCMVLYRAAARGSSQRRLLENAVHLPGPHGEGGIESRARTIWSYRSGDDLELSELNSVSP
jgi:hypothetical protein